MELKKNSKSDLRRWQGPFFNLSLAISVGATLVAFEWKADDKRPLLDISREITDWHTDYETDATASAPASCCPSRDQDSR
jgi:protein TonB